MWERHFPSMALFLLLTVATHCRPKELLALRRKDFVPLNRHTMKHGSLSFRPAGPTQGQTQDCRTLETFRIPRGCLTNQSSSRCWGTGTRNETYGASFKNDWAWKAESPLTRHDTQDRASIEVKKTNFGRGSAARNVEIDVVSFFDTTRAASLQPTTI